VPSPALQEKKISIALFPHWLVIHCLSMDPQASSTPKRLTPGTPEFALLQCDRRVYVSLFFLMSWKSSLVKFNRCLLEDGFSQGKSLRVGRCSVCSKGLLRVLKTSNPVVTVQFIKVAGPWAGGGGLSATGS
jgi:hypothetical protein